MKTKRNRWNKVTRSDMYCKLLYSNLVGTFSADSNFVATSNLKFTH